MEPVNGPRAWKRKSTFFVINLQQTNSWCDWEQTSMKRKSLIIRTSFISLFIPFEWKMFNVESKNEWKSKIERKPVYDSLPEDLSHWDPRYLLCQETILLHINHICQILTTFFKFFLWLSSYFIILNRLKWDPQKMHTFARVG